MSNEEINKTIAEFMGKKFYSFIEWNTTGHIKETGCDGMSFIIDGFYTRSLDNLIPAWEKLGINYFDCDTSHGNKNASMVLMSINNDRDYKSGLIYAETIHLVAAKSTALAIKELA